MPTITFSKKTFDAALGKKLPLEKLSEELEQIKVEVGSEKNGLLTVEVTGDRPDLMSAYGIARALRGRLGIEKGIPKIELHRASLKIIAEKDALKFRPVIVGAVVENVSLTHDSIAEIFQHQEKLDFVVGRKRKRVSIGLYDLDCFTPPVRFTTVDAKASFLPLKSTKKMSCPQILSQHPTGIEYAKLLPSKTSFPVLADAKNQILSLVPIINGVSGAVTTKTKRIFIDHTGTDSHACNASLNNLCQDFFDAGCKVSKVTVAYPDGEKTTPDSSPQKMRLSVAETNKVLGSAFTATQISSFLAKQRINSRVAGDWLECEMPAYRADFLHPADLIEEVALGFGYNNFEPKRPSVYTTGKFSATTLLENACRDFMAGAGFTEISTYIITNPPRIAKAKESGEYAEITNPVSDEYTTMRNSLLPGLLDCLSKNTHVPYPQKLFEVGEVVLPNSKLPERMETQIRAACISCHADSNLSEVASVLSNYALSAKKKLFLKKLSSPQFIEGRSAEVNIDAKTVGKIGELHPAVLENFGLTVPATAFEIVI